MLVVSHGDEVLRVKGILRVAGSRTRVVVHTVQHLVHAPVHLGRWPDGDAGSPVVFNVRDVDSSTIRRSLAAFRRLGL